MPPTDPATAPRIRSPRRRDIWILCAIVVLLMATVSTANLSVPLFAASDWRPSATELTWYVDAYVIAFACFLLPGDMFGGRFGQARVLLLGLALFAIANLVAAIAPGLTLLIAARAVAGIGAALALPQTLSLLLKRTPRGSDARVVAVWTASTSIAGVVGNGLGGILIQTFSWRSIFGVTVPLAVGLMVLVVVVVGVGRVPAARPRMDLGGMVLFVVAAVALLVVIIEAPTALLSPLPVIVAAAVFVGAAIPFALLELRLRNPMIDLRIFSSPVVRAASLGIVVTFVALFALFSINAHFIQTARGLGAAVAGLSLVPVALTMFVVTHASVPLLRRFGLAAVVAAGMVVSAAGYLLVVLWSTSAPLGVYEIALVVVGIGAGLCSSPLSTQVTSTPLVVGEPTGVGLNSTLRELSSSVGVGLSGVVLASFTLGATSGSTSITGDVVLESMRVTLTGVAVLLLLAAGLMFVDTRALAARRRRRSPR
jgi:MFS family permease